MFLNNIPGTVSIRPVIWNLFSVQWFPEMSGSTPNHSYSQDHALLDDVKLLYSISLPRTYFLVFLLLYALNQCPSCHLVSNSFESTKATWRQYSLEQCMHIPNEDQPSHLFLRFFTIIRNLMRALASHSQFSSLSSHPQKPVSSNSIHQRQFLPF